MNTNEISEYLEKMGAAFVAHRDKMEGKIESLERAYSRNGFTGGGGSSKNTKAEQEHREAFLNWARKGANPESLRQLEVQANLSTLEDPSGGYLVPVEMDKAIERLALSSVAMRRICRVVSARGDYQKPLSKGGAAGGWVAEKGDRDETDTPEMTLFSPPWCELYANLPVTQKLLDTSDFDVAAWLVEEITDVFTSTEGTAFITGDGVGKPRGITTYDMVADASWTYGKVGYIAGGHASLLNNTDKLFDLQHALKSVYRNGASWLMNDETFNAIRRMKDGEGNYLWRPGLEAGSPDVLLGKPVVIDDNMPDIGADAYPVAFGDFSRAYTVCDHNAGTRLLRDPYSKKGFVYFYTVKMVAGGISNFEAIKFLKVAVA